MAKIDKRIVKEIFGEERNNENETANAERRTYNERYRRRRCALLHSLTVYFESVPAIFLLLLLLSLILYPNPLLLSMGLLGFFVNSLGTVVFIQYLENFVDNYEICWKYVDDMFSDLTEPIFIASVVEAVFYNLLVAFAAYGTTYFNNLPTTIQYLLPISVVYILIYLLFYAVIAYIFDKISRIWWRIHL
jgi:hypothetical protein